MIDLASDLVFIFASIFGVVMLAAIYRVLADIRYYSRKLSRIFKHRYPEQDF